MYGWSFSKNVLLVLLWVGNLQQNFVGSTHNQAANVEKYCVEKIETDEMILMEQIRDAKDWALINGLTIPVQMSSLYCVTCRKKIKGIVLDDIAQIVPFSLYPSPFPRDLFQQALDVHKTLMVMNFRASLPQNFEFIKEMHKSVINVSNFLKSWVEDTERMFKEGFRQPLILFCNRADYMASEVIDEETNEKKYELKQVEINNGGSIGGYGIPPRISALHRRMLSKVGIDASTSVLPENRTSEIIARALHGAWSKFGDTDAVILFLHSKLRYMLIVESRAVQHAMERIFKDEKVPKCVFLTPTEGVFRLKLDPNNFSMVLDGKYVVAVSLSRDSLGFETTDEEKEVVRALKQSTAIQIPSYFTLMPQTKKMQQALSKPGVVEHFFPGPNEAHLAASIRRVLTKSWSIGEDEEEAEEIIRMIKANPENYVMKTNEIMNIKGKQIFFGKEIPKKLDTMTKEDREKFIIMEKLRPMVVKNHFVRAHAEPLLNVDVTPELGVHGCLLGNIVDGTVIEYFGPDTLMRTKLSAVNEGGVMVGNSVFDSPYLV